MNKELLEIITNDLFNYNVNKEILNKVFEITLEELEKGRLKNYELKSFMVHLYSLYLQGEK